VPRGRNASHQGKILNVSEQHGDAIDPAVTVWLVPLGRPGPAEIKGRLSIAERDLVFVDEEGGNRRIPLDSVRKVKRRLGSPVILVWHDLDGRRVETAFYFVQPPPLAPPPQQRVSLRPPSKRRARRVATNYLGHENIDRKPVVRSWVTSIRDAARRVREG
jgi:hypothetical protein